jgi:hypothetical protein
MERFVKDISKSRAELGQPYGSVLSRRVEWDAVHTRLRTPEDAY